MAIRTNNALVQTFAVNSLNELTTASNSGTLTVIGGTIPGATVTVNITNTASVYDDGSFAAPNMPLTTNYTAVASDGYRSVTNSVNVSLATNAVFQYDGNGNLTNDGLRNFAYDDENQMISVSVSNQWKSVFSYDGQLRRRIRQEFTWGTTNWIQTNAVYYIYDGNLVIQERDTNNAPTATYTRGKDLSGSLQGAGGIGGLLARSAPSTIDPSLTAHYFYHADGNGNVTMLINASQAIVAQYLYDASGNVLSKSGALAEANLYRFSSKEAHLNSGTIYYLYRFYDPNLQRWLNRDPIGENGGINLYGFAGNNPVNWIDPYGLAFGDYWDVNATANYYNQASANGLSQGGFSGYAKFAGAQLGEDLMDFFGAGGVQQSATQSGAASADPCHKKAALGYGALTAGMILMSAIPGEGKAVEMTADQIALKELVEEATLGGRKALNAADTEAVMQWAKETQYPGYRASPGDLANPSNWGANPVPHIHLPGAGSTGGHIPVTP